MRTRVGGGLGLQGSVFQLGFKVRILATYVHAYRELEVQR